MSASPLGINQFGAFTGATALAIQQALQAQGLGTTGNVYYLNPANGSDNGPGTTPATAFQTLAAAYAACASGNNDVVVLIGNGGTSASARITSFTWAKNATHLVGICAPSAVSQRARIANPTTAGLVITANFFTVSGNGCLFSNLSFFQGAGAGQTGVVAAILMTITGVRNAFVNVDFEGMGDATSATDAGSRCILISGGGQENFFKHCNIGLDTITRTAANASVEIAGGGPRNIFEDCTFPFLSSDGLQYALLAALGAAMDRWVLFKGCNFIATVSGGGLAIAQLFKLAAAVGGILCMDGNSFAYRVTALGDATTLAQTYVGGGTATNGVKGIVAT